MTPEEYSTYIKEHCPRLYGRQVMMWMFNPSFRKAVQDGDEAEIGRLLVEETGHTPQGEGFAACDEWEDALSRRAGRT